MKQLRHILYLLVTVLVVVACTDDDITGGENVPSADDHGIGQLVLFSSGNAANTTSRANVIPYMEEDGRFVCKMFYHAKATDTDASPFDTISTPITSWLCVNNNVGNSVYWQKDYDMTGVNTSHQDYLDYGFDSRAQYFYWRNRLDHIFLGFTDYNKLKTNVYGKEQGKLFMYPEYDDVKKTKVGEDVTWPTAGYYKLNISTDDDHLVCGAPTYTTTYPAGGSYSLYLAIPDANDVTSAIVSQLNDAIDASSMTEEDKTALKADIVRTSPTTPEETAEGTFRNYCWIMTYDLDKADPDTHIPDLTDPSTVIYCSREKKKIEDIIATAPANTFDLTRGTKTSMTEQPDPIVALTKMKPMGATQEANRVRLYFKHQFSQIQVNLVNAENTAEITKENIVSVELLGVSKKGYVFTNINPDGTQIPPSYDPVVKSQYTEEQIKENPHGTSFNMFVMADNAKPATSLKSFNAIAFGQLQAIRITWQEEATGETYTDETAAEANAKYLVANANGKKPGEAGYVATYKTGYTPVSAGDVVPPVKHVATYKITVDDRGNSLVNLRSGYRYMYDFELRRGTIAFIRATIDGWLLDDELDYNTSGTIHE